MSPRSRLFWAAVVAYALTAYGGVRSPDAEVTFRVAESLVDHGVPDVADLELWPGFGTAPGRDGRRYAVFGPLESVALAPFVAVARPLADRLDPRSVPHLPVSHYHANGLEAIFNGAPLQDARGHLRRLLASPFNVLVGALCVLAFHRLQRRLCREAFSADAATALFAFGTLLWPYAGTFFSEPLALACALFALDLLLPVTPTAAGGHESPPPARRTALAGALLGLAVTAHLSLVLYVPFFLLYLALATRALPRAARLRAGAWWLGGLALVLALLGAYNAARFGSPLETGRGVDPRAAALFEYGRFTGPWPGLYGLLFSSAKGLFVLCPAVVAGLVGWRYLHRRQPALSWALGLGLAFRVAFLACRSDWHGGFALGPRYLLVAIPFLLLPVGPLADELLGRGRRRALLALAAFSALCASLTIYLSLGDIFRHYQAVALRLGRDAFAGDRLYFDWGLGPIGHLHRLPVASFLLAPLGLGNPGLWLVLSAGAAAGFALLYRRAWRARP